MAEADPILPRSPAPARSPGPIGAGPTAQNATAGTPNVFPSNPMTSTYDDYDRDHRLGRGAFCATPARLPPAARDSTDPPRSHVMASPGFRPDRRRQGPRAMTSEHPDTRKGGTSNEGCPAAPHMAETEGLSALFL